MYVQGNSGRLLFLLTLTQHDEVVTRSERSIWTLHALWVSSVSRREQTPSLASARADGVHIHSVLPVLPVWNSW